MAMFDNQVVKTKDEVCCPFCESVDYQKMMSLPECVEVEPRYRDGVLINNHIDGVKVLCTCKACNRPFQYRMVTNPAKKAAPAAQTTTATPKKKTTSTTKKTTTAKTTAPIEVPATNNAADVVYTGVIAPAEGVTDVPSVTTSITTEGGNE